MPWENANGEDSGGAEDGSPRRPGGNPPSSGDPPPVGGSAPGGPGGRRRRRRGRGRGQGGRREHRSNPSRERGSSEPRRVTAPEADAFEPPPLPEDGTSAAPALGGTAPEAAADAPAPDPAGAEVRPELKERVDRGGRGRRRGRDRRPQRGPSSRPPERREARRPAPPTGPPPPEPVGEAAPVEAPPKPPQKPVEKVLLVNARDEEESRIALLEDGKLEELYVETAGERSMAGNVYRGTVQNVERGIGAGFVDLGRGLTGFLHVSDLPDRPAGPEGSSVTDLLEPGQEVMVQITRDSIGKKGPALTARIALPGRFLVLMPNSPRSGVSRRIGTGRDRDRMKRLLDQLDLPDGMGLIVRTAGETADIEPLRRDLKHLLDEWEALKEKAASAGIPGLLRGESDLAERCVRDIMPPDVSKIVVDDEATAAKIRSLIEAWCGATPAPADPSASVAPAVSRVEGAAAVPDGAEPAPAPTPAPDTAGPPVAPTDEALAAPSGPSPVPQVLLHTDPMPIFHAFGAESQIEDAYRRAIRLPAGGSIVIDPTEALVAIDVNSGRLTDEEDPESTALVTNLEAIVEATRQLRLRDLGGLVVIDFIDLRDRKAIRKVERALKDALARDRARIRVGRMGEFGCVILSRQRIRQALTRVTHEECAACGGTGRRRVVSGLGLRVLREMEARLARSRGRVGLEVRAPQPVIDWIKKHRSGALKDLRHASAGAIRLEADARLAADGWAMKGLPPEGAASGPAIQPTPEE